MWVLCSISNERLVRISFSGVGSFAFPINVASTTVGWLKGFIKRIHIHGQELYWNGEIVYGYSRRRLFVLNDCTK